MNEVWRDIPGYEGLYQVSNLGQVKSLACVRSVHSILRKNGCRRNELWFRKERILVPVVENRSYKVRLYARNHVRTSFLIKYLVAITFLDFPIDGNPRAISQHVKGPDMSVANIKINWSKVHEEKSL